MSAARYVELLNDADLVLLGEAAGERDADQASRLRAAPERVEELLGRRSVYEALFTSPERRFLPQGSPFLAFSVLVGRAAHDLADLPFVQEWIAPGQRLPVFDVEQLRDFTGLSRRRLFLSELLTSYTRVTSGSVWVRTRRGWGRRRYSDLDLLRLAELLEVVPHSERPAVQRRIGDLALFLSGVFPDHAGRGLLPPRHLERIRRLLEAGARPTPDALGLAVAGADNIAVLEWLGRRAYLLAQSAWGSPGSGIRSVLEDVAERFRDARRTLNFITDRYLFPAREGWFGRHAS